jgi:isoquinoline 1-oxidoreductase beta subunit
MVAVVGDHMWAAKQGLDALDIVGRMGINAQLLTRPMIWQEIAGRQSKRRRLVAKKAGRHRTRAWPTASV